MKFGVREICDVTFKALQNVSIGGLNFKKGQPVLYIDSAKTSTIEGAATTVYATGGKGNARLIAWEGEKTLTFTVEDALLSEVGFAILSGAGLFKGVQGEKKYNVHCTETVTAYKDDETQAIVCDLNMADNDTLSTNAPIFVMEYENGSIKSGVSVVTGKKQLSGLEEGKTYFVDYYVLKNAAVTEMSIDAENFAGYYYVEASTLFRRESDGKDLPAEIIFPRVKIQSNFTFTMASSGDPSTFTFTMDAMPAYTWFEKDKKVLCAIQVIDEDATDLTREAVTDEVYADTSVVSSITETSDESTENGEEEQA